MAKITNKEDKINPCRCPKCFLIPSITIYEEENKIKLNFICPNNHEFNEDFESLHKKSKIDIENIQCKTCNNKKSTNKFYLCNECNNFFCKQCKIYHAKNYNHLCININKCDSRCKIHNKDLLGYSQQHKKNYCNYCSNSNSDDFKKYKFIYDEEMNKYLKINKNYEDQINNNKQKLNSFVKKIEELVLIIKNIIKTSYINQSIEIDFQKEIINTYKYMKEQKNLNYQIIENVRNVMKIPIKTELNENINSINEKVYDNFINEIKYKLNMIKENDKFKDFKIENMDNFKTLTNNQRDIWSLSPLNDGRFAAGDSFSNLIIYNKQFEPDLVIKNNLGNLFTFTQLKNKNIACSFLKDFTLKIIKINDNNQYEDIQIIKKAHNERITKIIELKNENLITFSWDYSFKIWKSNKNKYEKIYEFKDINELSDGLEIKDNEIVYALNSKPQSLVFYDLNKKEKTHTLNNLNLCTNNHCRIIKLNNKQIVVAGTNKIYLIDINNYLISYEIKSDPNDCILKLSNDLFLTGDENGTIKQFKVKNKQLIKESCIEEAHDNSIWSIIFLNDMIISGGFGSNEIKIWKK